MRILRTSDTIYGFDGEYRFLSNFLKCPIKYEGWVYPSTEHAFQAAKTLDPEQRRWIETCSTPGAAKEAGRALKGLRPDWDKIKYGIMLEILFEKFSHIRLREKLLATGDALLVEANTWGDRTWGVDQSTGVGQNALGILLMTTRLGFRG